MDKMIEIAEVIQPCSVRALAYQLFVQGLIPSMGTAHTKKVSTISVNAREEGEMPWEWIVDKTRLEDRPASWEDLNAYGETVRRLYRKDKWNEQPTLVSVWSEKDTIEGSIRPVLDKYEVPFQVLHGWSGATPIHDAAQANLYRKQDTLILYVGDYDPSGMSMSEKDLPQRLARYSSLNPAQKKADPEWVEEYLASLHLTIRRIALTVEDTRALGRRLGFPATDKKKDSRYAWFVANYGNWCWELDALAPNVLRDRLELAILAAMDRELWERYVQVERAEQVFLDGLCESWEGILGPVPEYGSNEVDDGTSDEGDSPW
jgi:hypothetical protein